MNPPDGHLGALPQSHEADAAAALKQAMGGFVTGVTVVTCLDRAGRLQGLTANAFTALSLDPPLVLVCVNRDSRTYAAVAAHDRFAVHILDDSQAEVAKGFAARGTARERICPWRTNLRGVPMLDRYHVAFECALHDEFPGGDHAILIGRVEQAHQGGGTPLVYYRKRLFGLA